MSLVVHMDGTQCGEVHLLYMDRRAAIVIHVWIIICFGILRLCFLLLFSRVAVLFSTRVFPVGNSYLILREGEVLELHFLISAFWPSYLLQLQRSFYLDLGCVAACSEGGSL